MRIKQPLFAFCGLLSIGLLGLNMYGEVFNMRVAEDIPAQALKFDDDVTYSIEETLTQINRRPGENDLQFAIRLTTVVQKSLAHIENWETQPPDLFAQRVPIKENIWLHLAGRFSGEAQVQRYHFADYRKTVERGIGICGDTSAMLSDILWDNNIPNSILAYQRHVVVEVRPDNQPAYIIDGDYGAYYENTVTDVDDKKSLINKQYKNAGYSEEEARKLANILTEDFVTYGSTYDFMKKRYLMEKALYGIKWLLPVVLLLISVIPTLLRRSRAITDKHRPIIDL